MATNRPAQRTSERGDRGALCRRPGAETTSWCASQTRRKAAEKAGKGRRAPFALTRGRRAVCRRPAVCRTFVDGETRTRTGDTTIFSPAAASLESRRKSCIPSCSRRCLVAVGSPQIPGVWSPFGRCKPARLPIDARSAVARRRGSTRLMVAPTHRPLAERAGRRTPLRRYALPPEGRQRGRSDRELTRDEVRALAHRRDRDWLRDEPPGAGDRLPFFES
jgi:hypothetical protein